MEQVIPAHLRECARVEALSFEADGAYSVRLAIEAGEQNAFIPLLSRHTLNAAERAENEQIAAFKRKYAHLWAQGYDMASTVAEKGVVFGCSKDGKFRGLETIGMDLSRAWRVPVVVKLRTEDLAREILLFHSMLYGYDAVTSPVSETPLPVRFQQKCKCRACGCRTYRVYVNIHNTGKEDLLAQGTDAIDEENWTNAFDWFSVDLQCAHCGKQRKNWFEMETM